MLITDSLGIAELSYLVYCSCSEYQAYSEQLISSN